MSICQNMLLLTLIVSIITIGYFFLPQQSVKKLIYKPNCLSLFEKSQYICAYCSINILDINQKRFKAIGIKDDSPLSCSQYLQIIDYQNSPMKSYQIQLETMDPIKKIFQQSQAQYLINTNNTPTNIFIDKFTYKSIVIFEINTSPLMNTAIYQIQQSQVIPKFSIFLSAICILTILFIILSQYINGKSIKYQITINILILILVLLASKQNLPLNINEYQYPAMLFFCLCLLKVHTKIFITISMLIIMLFGRYLRNVQLVLGSYIICLIIFMINGCNQIKYGKIFIFVLTSMIIYIFGHSYRQTKEINIDINYEFGKLLQIVILTMTTTLIESSDETIIQQFIEAKQIIDKRSQSFEEFSEILEEDNIQE